MDPQAARLQILATEHWSLLASRSLAWNESFSRAGMFLTAVSGSVVTLALLAQGFGFGRTFAWCALAVLPVVFLLGIATYLRLGAANYHEFQCVLGMNRIRAAYLRMAPDLEPHFVMSAHDDMPGLSVTMALPPGQRRWPHLLSATPAVVGVLTAVIAGVIGVLLGYLLGGGAVVLAAAGVAAAAVTLVSFARVARVNVARTWAAHQPLFPTSE
ncbi:MAG TPA: hypothetical protein VF062_18145 [Candidatus Limnocylindrales bacterium]